MCRRGAGNIHRREIVSVASADVPGAGPIVKTPTPFTVRRGARDITCVHHVLRTARRMYTVLDRDDHETTARLELRALERMIVVLCEDIERRVSESGLRSKLAAREGSLQLAVFAERRTAALQALEPVLAESLEIRISRLERLVQALDCSRAYFITAASTRSVHAA